MQKILVLSKNKQSVTGSITKYFNSKFSTQNIQIEMIIKEYSDLEVIIDTKDEQILKVHIDGTDIKEYDLVFFRGGQQTLFTELAYSITQYCKINKIRFVNSLHETYAFKSKLGQMVLLSINGLPVPKTLYIPSEKVLSKIEIIKENFQLPVIMKSTSSHLGMNNFLIKDYNEIIDILAADEDESEFIFQEFIPNSFDYRIFVLNSNDIGSAEKRVRLVDNIEHRNNVKVGAIEEFINPEKLDKKIAKIALDATKLFDIEVCGVDIIQDNETQDAYILELNASPGITFDTIESESLFNYLIKKLKE